MDDQLESHPSMPFLSRVDRLDYLMKYIAGTSLWRGYSFLFGKKKRECMPLDVAAEEAQSKGALLDRIGSLEARLVQLSLEIESRKASTSTSGSASASASTTSGGRETNYSYPTFNNPKRRQEQSSQHHEITNGESQSKKGERLEQKKKQKKKEKEASLRKQKLVNNSKRDEKKCKNGKKGIPYSWPHLRILGC